MNGRTASGWIKSGGGLVVDNTTRHCFGDPKKPCGTHCALFDVVRNKYDKPVGAYLACAGHKWIFDNER